MSSAKIELKIYADDDSVIETFATNRIRWGVIEDVVELQDKLQGKSEKESIKAMGQFLKLVFPSLTDDLLRQADVNDIKLCFMQLVSVVKNIEGAEEKNV